MGLIGSAALDGLSSIATQGHYMQFTFTFQADDVAFALKPIVAALNQPEGILSSVGESLLRVNRQRHDNEQAPDGSKWQALSPLTLLTKRKNRILYEKVRIFSVNSTRVQKRSALHQTHAADNAASIRPALCALKS